MINPFGISLSNKINQPKQKQKRGYPEKEGPDNTEALVDKHKGPPDVFKRMCQDLFEVGQPNFCPAFCPPFSLAIQHSKAFRDLHEEHDLRREQRQPSLKLMVPCNTDIFSHSILTK